MRVAPAAPPLRRALLTCDSVGGVWTYALDLARGLAEAGVAVTLAVLGPVPRPAQEADAAGVPGLDLVATGLPLDWTAASPDDVRAAGAALAGLASAVRADVVHLHGPALAAGARFPGPVLATCHSCVGTWWRAVRGDAPMPPDLAWRADLVREGCGRADALAAPTRAFAREVAAAYGLSGEPIVVPNGIRIAAPSAPPPPAGPVVAFTAGRLWDEGKNVALLEAAAALTPVRIEAAGETRGPNGAAVSLRRVAAVGHLPPAAMDRRLAARPVFASPALYEPFGLSVLEAARHGCPLVLADIPTFRETWEGAATFLDPRDPAAWAAAIGRLAADSGGRDALGARAASRAGRFGLDATVRGTLALYGDVLAGSARSAA